MKADESSEKGDSAQNGRLSTDIKVKRIEKNAPESDTKKKIVENVLDVNENIPGFTLHVPFWVGSFYYEKQQIEVVNTCTIDSFLFALWVIKQLIPDLIQNLPKLEETKVLETIIKNIKSKEWNTARQNWYTQIMKKDISNIKKVDFFGELEQCFSDSQSGSKMLK